MSGVGVPVGPFRGLVPYDERSAALFFGRSRETASLVAQVTRDGARVTALTGEAGVGKTSVLRAGLIPALARQGVLGLYLGGYDALDQQVWQAGNRAGAGAPAAGESPSDYLVRIARSSRGGALLILDHLELALGPPLL